MSDTQELRKNFRNLTCGGCAGVLSRTVVSPLERLKILYQIQYVTTKAGGAQKYGGTIDSLRLILKEEGFRGFYKGNGANAIRVFPYVGIQFAAFSKFSKLLKPDATAPIKLSPIEKLGVGASAGMVSVLATYPLDLIRGRLTAQGGALKQQYSGLVDCLVKTLKAEGPRGLYHGISPTLLGIGPYVGTNFLVYETLKENAPVEPGAKGPNAYYLALCGGVAGTTGQTVAYPLDLMRRRFQMQSLPGSSVSYANPFSAFVTIVRDEGFLGLYKGYLPNFIKTWPTIAIMFFANDMLKRSEFIDQVFGTDTNIHKTKR